MSQKQKKYNPNKKYKFDFEKGEYIQKNQFVELLKNPTAIIYVRVSDQKQVDEGNGLESQEATCRRRAELKQIPVLKVFSDGGVSGAKLDRKGLYEAIDYLKKENSKHPKVLYFICTEISRISRSEDIAQTMEMKKRIETTGVEIVLTHSGRNISNENISDSFMTDFDIIRAKSERLQIRERSLNGSKAKLYSGHRIFDVPAGYERIHIKNGSKTEKFLQMVEPQASIIKEGLEFFANGIFINKMQLLEYFNEKKLKSNSHSSNPGKLGLTFVQRLFEIEKLYFYAGYILYPNPNYGITKPVEAVHVPLISLSTAHKILKRLDLKGGLKFGPRKDTSDLYPLRGMVCCPNCNYPMTARPSTGKMGTIYHYYGCNRKDCIKKECINIDTMHADFEKLLSSLTPKKGIIVLLDGTLKEVMQEKNKLQATINDAKKRRIKEIDVEIDNFRNTVGKLSKPAIIQKLEEKWAELEQEKEILENELQDKALSDRDFVVLYDRVKNIILDPLSVWELGSTDLKMLLVGVLFGGKLYYKKNEGYQTPQISALYGILDHLKDGIIPSGAGDGTRTRNSLLGRQAL